MNDESTRTGHTALIVVDHGSVRAEANQMLERFVEQFRQAGDWVIVEAAHMELAEPSIAAAFDRCVEQGAQRVVVVPYFLGPGKHSQQDIPNLTAEAAAKHSGIRFTVAEPIGLHPLMQKIIAERADNSRPAG